MEKKEVKTMASASGIGFCGLLTIVFIVLKLLGIISWSWFWVLSPLIFSIGFGILVVFVCIAIIIITAIIANM